MSRSISWHMKPSRQCLPGQNSRSRHATSRICAPPAIFVAESGLFWTLRPETAGATLAHPFNQLLIILCPESYSSFRVERASRPLELARSYPDSRVDPSGRGRKVTVLFCLFPSNFYLLPSLLWPQIGFVFENEPK